MSDFIKQRLLFFRASLFLALLLILYLTTTEEIPRAALEVNDKAGHLLAFLCLALLTDYSFPAKGFTLCKSLSLVFYGIFIECIQYYLPYRSFSLLDILADSCGVYVYPLISSYIQRIPGLNKENGKDVPTEG